MNDAELLRDFARRGDQAAFAEVARRHGGLVFAAARRQLGGDRHRAQEVTQVVFLTLAKNAARVAGHPAVAAWLYRCTRHAVAKARRGDYRRGVREAAAAQLAEAGEPGVVEWARVEPVLDEAMERLGETDRRAVLLRFFEGWTYAEVGAALGVGENAARMRTERALEKLKSALERRGVTSTAAALGGALASYAAPAAPAGVLTAVNGVLGAVGATGAGVIFLMMNVTKYAACVAAGLLVGGVGVGLWTRSAEPRPVVANTPLVRVAGTTANTDGLAADRARLERENAALREKLATARERANTDGEAAALDRARLEELRRPMELDVISSTLRAKLKPGESVVTGGALMPGGDGRRLFVFGRPEQQTKQGKSAVAFQGKIVQLSDEAAKSVGLEGLMTNAANTLQHGEVWAPGEEEAVMERLYAYAKTKGGVDVMSAPTITPLSGDEGSILIGDSISTKVRPVAQADGNIDLEMRVELANVPETAGQEKPTGTAAR
jgi:RNA polymerase sigma factor (sigma-70 family)